MRIDVSLEHRDLEAELAGLHDRMRRPGDVLHGLPAIPAPLPDLVFRYRETDGDFYIYVEDSAHHVLAGCTVFSRVAEVDRSVGRSLRSPHSRYAAGYRRRGIASAVYRWALASGLCLISGPRQSPAAHRLWMALARTHELAYVRMQGKRLQVMGAQVEESALEDLDTRMVLLGAGWTLRRFGKLAPGEGARLAITEMQAVAR